MSYPATKVARLIAPLMILTACAPPRNAPAQNSPPRAKAQNGPSPVLTQDDPRHVTGQVNLPFFRCLEALSRAAKVRIKIHPILLQTKLDVPDTIHLSVKDLPFNQTLQRVLDYSRTPLTYRVANGVYLILPDSARNNKAQLALPNTGHGVISLANAHIPFDEAIDGLFRGQNIRYRIEPSVEATDEPVSYEVNKATLDEALKVLLAAVPDQKTPLTFRVENGVYILAQKSAGNPPTRVASGGQPVINLDLKHATLDLALAKLLKQAHVNYLYLPPAEVTGDITLTLKNAPFDKALAKILRSVDFAPPLLARQRDDILVIARSFPPTVADSRLDQPHITMSVEKVTLYNAIQSLFSLTNHDYVLAPEVRNWKITCAFQALPLDSALDTLLKQTRLRLGYHVEKGLYHIGLSSP